jgi:cytochrome c-type biogenesis protein CcmH
MSFWIAAVAIPLVAAVLLAWPLLSKGKQWLGFGVAVLLIVPTVTLYLYQGVGTPEGIGVQGSPGAAQRSSNIHSGTAAQDSGEMGDMLRQMEARLATNPDDLDGWMLLGRSYKAVQQYPQAVMALRNAQRLAPDEPLVKVELAEALIFTSQGQTTDETRELLAAAISASPDLQKGLWLSGIVAAEDGDDEKALGFWQRLMNTLEPGSAVANSVQEQMDLAVARLGMPATMPPTAMMPPSEDPADRMPNLGAPVRPAMPGTAAPAPAPAMPPMGQMGQMGQASGAAAPSAASRSGGPWEGLVATVNAPGDLGPLPGSATLFVIARDPAAPNPPLGAMRIPNPVFPITVQLTDANSMMPERPISGPQQIEISARLSMTGNVMPSGSDPQSAPALVSPNVQERIELQLARP